MKALIIDFRITTSNDQYEIEEIRYSAFDFRMSPIDVGDRREEMQRFYESSKPA